MFEKFKRKMKIIRYALAFVRLYLFILFYFNEREGEQKIA